MTGVLRSGRTVPDEVFDEIYPDVVRRASSVHWTPMCVCKRIVELLRLQPGERVLDIGAGAGKFCIVLAAMTGARLRGIERQHGLVEVAREAARRLMVDVEFVEAAFTEEDARHVDVAYFFNPFVETILLPGASSYAADRFAGRIAQDVGLAERFLASARNGMRIVTFFGFGGTMPPEYERLAQEQWDGGQLEVWQKVAEAHKAR